VHTRTVRAALVATAIAALAGCDSKLIVAPGAGAPLLTILAPSEGATVSGVAFVVTADATDDDGIARLEFRLGDGPTVVDDSPPFSARIVTLTLPADLAVTVHVEAFDTQGHSTAVDVPLKVGARTLTQLTTDVHSDSNPAWSPDGTRIAFQADRDGAQLDLWIMDADGGNQTRLTTNVNEDRHPAFSPDGNWLAFDSDRAGTFDIWLMPLAIGEAAAESLTFGDNDDVEPAWSPGGSELYFASSRGAGNFDIYRQNVATGVAVQITSFNSDERGPAVSPDGLSLAFTSSLNFATPHVYTMVLGDVGVLPLTGDVGVTEADPAWTPGADVVLFSRSTSLGGNVWLKEMDDTAAAAQVTFGSGIVGDGGAAWAPDGTKLAFHSDRSGNLDIWLVE
jgi:Tol biopolymer transport system component